MFLLIFIRNINLCRWTNLRLCEIQVFRKLSGTIYDIGESGRFFLIELNVESG